MAGRGFKKRNNRQWHLVDYKEQQSI